MIDDGWVSLEDIRRNKALKTRFRITAQDINTLDEALTNLKYFFIHKELRPELFGPFFGYYADELEQMRLNNERKCFEIQVSILPELLETVRGQNKGKSIN
jgi:hypothetical protein